METAMTGNTAASASWLICVSGSSTCGIPLTQVVESMRALTVERVPGMPSFMTGMAMIRGAQVPVVHLGELLGESTLSTPTRYITLKLDRRIVALAVDSVTGVMQLATDAVALLPPLLRAARSEMISMVGTLDNELLLTLETTKLIPETLWQQLETQQAASRGSQS
jgi:purine-binding chemotaxis protein CheW